MHEILIIIRTRLDSINIEQKSCIHEQKYASVLGIEMKITLVIDKLCSF